jgi:hypothetical protein
MRVLRCESDGGEASRDPADIWACPGKRLLSVADTGYDPIHAAAVAIRPMPKRGCSILPENADV